MKKRRKFKVPTKRESVGMLDARLARIAKSFGLELVYEYPRNFDGWFRRPHYRWLAGLRRNDDRS